jgi:hypothetical protein
MWLTFPLARAEVARVTGYGADAAAEWLREVAIRQWVRVRYAPRYQQSIKPLVFPFPVSVGGSADLLPPYDQPRLPTSGQRSEWHSPLPDFEQGPAVMHRPRTINAAEWWAEELRAALARDFPAAAAAPVSPAVVPDASQCKPAKRGPKPRWEWESITRKAKLAYAKAGGAMQWKNLVTLILDLAQDQTGTRPGSDSTAEQLAAKVRDDWRRYLGEPDN